MVEVGFGPQVQTVLSQVRPDAQLIMVSATFPKAMRHLSRQYFSDDAVHFIVNNKTHDGTAGCAASRPGAAPNHGSASLVSEDVDDRYIVLKSIKSQDERFSWLTSNLPSILANGLAIIFCATRGGTAALANKLRGCGFAVACIHGETDMADRMELMKMFRKRELQLLCATDIAARGLDVDGVRTVVNFEPASSYEDHVHRAGRTGRAGSKGQAFTLLLPSSSKDVAFARSAISALRSARVAIPQTLLSVASEQHAGSGKQERGRRGRGGFGLRGRSRH